MINTLFYSHDYPKVIMGFPFKIICQHITFYLHRMNSYVSYEIHATCKVIDLPSNDFDVRDGVVIPQKVHSFLKIFFAVGCRVH